MAPTAAEHLAVPARGSRLLRYLLLCRNLLAADSPEKVLAILREAEVKL